jgi:uncharacterized membrane protein (UPF0127 family)
MRLVSISNNTRETIVGERIGIADTSLDRMVGLLGKHGIADGGGLWIKPSSGVHTVGMKFPIDVIGLDGKGKVVKLWSNLVPYRLTSISWKMQSAIELPAGQIEKSNVQLGDILQVQELLGFPE